jgi:uncharacterized membrane protein
MKLSDFIDELINNKRDPRLMIPRPYPRVGWTFNFAHPLTWVFIIVLVLVIVLCAVFIR